MITTHSKPESNSDNLEILTSVFSIIFYHIFLKHSGELRIEYLNFLFWFQCSMLSKTSTIQSFVTVQKLNSQCSQSHFFTYESINACENLETSCLYSDFVFSSISKIRQRNSNSYFNLLLLLSGDISSNPGPLCNNQLQTQNELSTFNSRDLHFTISTLRVCYLK